jgi:hypothetical protein
VDPRLRNAGLYYLDKGTNMGRRVCHVAFHDDLSFVIEHIMLTESGTEGETCVIY